MRALPFALFLLTAGCDKPAPVPKVEFPPRSTDPRDGARARGTAYLLAHQSKDGAWRSDVYGHFRGGDALTPLVVVALQGAPPVPATDEAIERGLAFMDRFVKGGAIDPEARLVYPVYAAGLMAKALADHRQQRRRAARDAWARLLLDWQMNGANGWAAGDWQYGGWGYYGVRPVKPADGPVPDALEANLSATVVALEGLNAAGIPPKHEAYAAALAFVCRCQNFSLDPERDDGGFFFTPGDPFRNKAGLASAPGEEARYRSYGSATADGLRCLRACGAANLRDDGEAREARALAWLAKRLAAALENKSFAHPGDFAPDRLKDRDAALYYFAASLALTSEGGSASLSWVRGEVAKRQFPDGSWQNALGQVREDDPLLATALAVLALRGG
jgi:hypothetical protein